MKRTLRRAGTGTPDRGWDRTRIGRPSWLVRRPPPGPPRARPVAVRGARFRAMRVYRNGKRRVPARRAAQSYYQWTLDTIIGSACMAPMFACMPPRPAPARGMLHGRPGARVTVDDPRRDRSSARNHWHATRRSTRPYAESPSRHGAWVVIERVRSRLTAMHVRDATSGARVARRTVHLAHDAEPQPGGPGALLVGNRRAPDRADTDPCVLRDALPCHQRQHLPRRTST